MKRVLSIVFGLVLFLLSVSCSKENTVDMSLLTGRWELVEPKNQSSTRTMTFDGDKCVSVYNGFTKECGYTVDGHKIHLSTDMLGAGFYYLVTRLDSKYLEFDSIIVTIMPNKEYSDGTYTYKRIE